MSRLVGGNSRPYWRVVADRLGRDYWTFFCAAFCMDLGFGLFIFLFNLYLTDIHFDERSIGHILAFFTFGNVVGTVPGMMVTRRRGLRPLLVLAFCAVPVLSVLRVFIVTETAQCALAFLSGAALCGWPICFSPTIAQLTDERNRSIGFGLAFAAGIGLGSLAGIAGGYIPEILHRSILHLDLVTGIRAVLLSACAVVALGLWPLSMLNLPHKEAARPRRIRIVHPYLLRFLPAFVLWNVVTGSFPAFGAIYLQKALGMPLGKLGAVFALSQLMQFVAVLSSPLLFKKMGKGKGVAMAQAGTAVLLVSLAMTRFVPAAVCFYVLYFAAQFMCGPGIYQMLMDKVPEEERSSASALQNLSGALCQSMTMALTGVCIVAYGYRALLLVNSGIALLAGVMFAWLGKPTLATAATLARDSWEGNSSPSSHESEWCVPEAAE